MDNILKDTLNALVPVANAASAVQKQNEKYEDAYKQNQIQQSSSSNEGLVGKFGGVFNILIFAVAAYLSWSCNTRCYRGMGVLEKSVRAFFAGVFGLIYLLLYVIFWSSDCGKCEDVVPSSVAVNIMDSSMPVMPSQSIYF